ncbi:MAG: VWA domain-containing protein [Oscillospiraceae bacterium]|nr:VWA domain-containing protein [Oscillospiraceae bacterium]
MKKLKKLTSALTAIILAAAMLSGCGGDKSATDEAYIQNNAVGDSAGEAYYDNYGKAEGGYIATTAAAIEEEIVGEAPMADSKTAAKDDFAPSENYFNTEEYNPIIENSYMSVAANPLSTFSIDVDTASYTNLRRMITEGYGINPSAIRIEEMINYFDYDYPAPKADEPFSVTTEIADCPWNKDTKLMLVGLQAEEIDLSEREPMNLVFLIDVSGSMYDSNKLPLVQKSFCMLTENLTAQDRISIVTYAGYDEVVLEGAEGSHKDTIENAINSLSAGGSTAGADGIKTAYKIAEKYFIEGGNNRIILATDGDLNVGISSESDLTDLVEEKRETGVFLSVLGFGTGNYKDNKMEALADNGNGNYAYIDSELEAKKVLVEEMGGTLFTVAKDVKIQVEFNPAYIKGYRLVGYENRALAAEDFADDTKDAGEIGAGHSVTALYEVVMNDSPMEFDTSDLKYQETVSGEDNGELLTVALRYKAPDGDTSKLLEYPVTMDAYTEAMSENLTFAAGVAEFGLVLRNSEYKGTATCQSILTMLADYDYSSDEYKDEFIYLVKTMKRQGY